MDHPSCPVCGAETRVVGWECMGSVHWCPRCGTIHLRDNAKRVGRIDRPTDPVNARLLAACEAAESWFKGYPEERGLIEARFAQEQCRAAIAEARCAAVESEGQP